jgi:phosphoribosylformylglycinamidine synthase
MNDVTIRETFKEPEYDINKIHEYLANVLQLEAVACKDWLTNKVDRSVTGKVARQQCQGEIQLPLSDLGAVALDYRGKAGIATSIGHAPQATLTDAAAGSVLAIAEALTNIVFAPLKDKLNSVSLSANWMWPCKNPGEDARLYKAVEACSEFARDLGINIPTGKDSLSMTQKYGNEKVYSPGTVIISAGAEVSDIRKIVSPVLVNNPGTSLYHIKFSLWEFELGGSALAQTLNSIGNDVPIVDDAKDFKEAFNTIQELIESDLILAGHDISAGGMITTLLEMCFGNESGGLAIDFSGLLRSYVPPYNEKDLLKILFSENPGIIIQVADEQAVERVLLRQRLSFNKIGHPIDERQIIIQGIEKPFDIDELRDIWYRPSYLLDRRQSGEICAQERFTNYKNQPVQFKLPANFKGALPGIENDRKIKAAIIREKGTNGEREMAYALYLAGFDVKDVHTTDLASGRETLEEVNLIVFCGGFSNSDVLGSAKGWAGAFRYNEKAREALAKFYARPDTLSLGICNGCQLMVELNLINPEHTERPVMLHNDSHKFESEFLSVAIPPNRSVMFESLSGTQLGIWVAHGEGKFHLPLAENNYHIIAKYAYDTYPGNPNGSDYSVAGICSEDGRHLAMMPHLERAIFPWQWAYYPQDRKKDEVSPWIEAFVNARQWIEKK